MRSRTRRAEARRLRSGCGYEDERPTMPVACFVVLKADWLLYLCVFLWMGQQELERAFADKVDCESFRQQQAQVEAVACSVSVLGEEIRSREAQIHEFKYVLFAGTRLGTKYVHLLCCGSVDSNQVHSFRLLSTHFEPISRVRSLTSRPLWLLAPPQICRTLAARRC